jgi:hypothetical protein
MTDEIEAVTEASKAIQEVAKTTGKAIDLSGENPRSGGESSQIRR